MCLAKSLPDCFIFARLEQFSAGQIKSETSQRLLSTVLGTFSICTGTKLQKHFTALPQLFFLKSSLTCKVELFYTTLIFPLHMFHSLSSFDSCLSL